MLSISVGLAMKLHRPLKKQTLIKNSSSGMLMRTTRETFSLAVNYVARVLVRDFCPLFDGSLRIVISLTGGVSTVTRVFHSSHFQGNFGQFLRDFLGK